MARRRALSGTPLLIASGAAMVIGCGGARFGSPPPPLGNLMPPPEVMAEICVDPTPSHARVVVRGTQEHTFTERCKTINTYGSVQIEVRAPRYSDQTINPSVNADGKNEFAVSLIAGPLPPPVGNLVAPPSIVHHPRPPLVVANVCVDPVPKHAKVVFTGGSLVPQVATERCTEVKSYGLITIDVSAPGYASFKEVMNPREVGLELELAPVLTALRPDVAPRPVGNLMPPPKMIPDINE